VTSARAGTVLALVVVLGAACGKKGPPLPPLRLPPPVVADLMARRTPARVEVRLRVPTAVAGTTVSAERVEIYRRLAGPDDPVPQPAALVEPDALWRTVTVQPADAAAAGDATTAAPGVWVTVLDEDPAGDASRRQYVAVAVAGRSRRGGLSSLVQVPTGPDIQPPRDVGLAYDEQLITLTWTPADEGQQFEVLAATADGQPGSLLTTDPVDGAPWSQRVEMGRETCFVVRAVQVNGGVVLESPLVGPACETPVDRFPPAPPANLVAAATAGAVSLVWSPVAAADLGGYLVLRGDGPSGTLQPLMAAPIAETTWRDATVTLGTAYTYAVVAVDRATPPNMSAESNRQTVTVR